MEYTRYYVGNVYSLFSVDPIYYGGEAIVVS